MLNKLFQAVSSIFVPKSEFPSQPAIKLPAPMRWYDTCSVSAMPVYETLVNGTIVREFKELRNPQPVHYITDDDHPNYSRYVRYYECELENGKTLTRMIREFHKAEDGVLEFWN